MNGRPLYVTLGLDDSATAEQVEAAYRKLAREHHPDRGGDEATFKSISDAYSVLADPIRRQQYDRYGTFDNGAKVDRQQLATIAILSTVLLEAMRGADPATMNIKTKMLTILRNKKNDVQGPFGNLAMARGIVGKLKGRFSVKADENLMEQIVGQHLSKMQEEIERMENQIAELDRAIEMLNTYEYRVDLQDGLFIPGSWRDMPLDRPQAKIDGRY